MKLDDFTQRHLAEYVCRYGPTNRDASEVVAAMQSFIESLDEEEAQRLLSRGWPDVLMAAEIADFDLKAHMHPAPHPGNQ